MPTIHRQGALRFVIYLNDHDPPHVHVFCPGGEAKIELEGGTTGVSLVWARGFERKMLRQALIEAAAQRAKLMAAWQRLHGSE